MIWEEMTYNQLDYSFTSRLEKIEDIDNQKNRKRVKVHIKEITIDEDEINGDGVCWQFQLFFEWQ